MPREKRPRSRSPPRSSHSSSKRSVSTKEPRDDRSRDSRDSRDSKDEFKKPVDKISKILRGNVRVPQNQALLEKSIEPSKADVSYKISIQQLLILNDIFSVLYTIIVRRNY